MILVKNFYKVLKKNKVNFFTGVPDSVLKLFLKKLSKLNKESHVEVFNEGSAVSTAIGYYLATKKIPCVYFQNSGLGNAINPLISIAHSKVYSIPLLLLIGWRGSPYRLKDEPQHNQKGIITRTILKLMGIKNIVIRSEKNLIQVSNLIREAKKTNKPVAVLIENKTFFEIQKKENKYKKNNNGIKREFFINHLLNNIKRNTKIVSTTGYTSRELYQIRKNQNWNRGDDFYMVGGMGHSLMVSLGYCLKKKNETLCLDGDGSILMHMGGMRSAGIFAKKNLKHVIFNNYCHESVGGQKTYSEGLNFRKVARELGYKYTDQILNQNNIEKKIKKFLNSKGPSLIEVLTKTGTLKNLKRPNNFIEIKKNFIK